MHPAKNMTDEELLKAIKPLAVHANWDYLIEHLVRQQAHQTKRAMSLSEPVEIYRAQGRVHALDQLLTLKDKLQQM